jgi:hypothetical protein
MLRIDFLAFLIGLRHVEADRTFNGSLEKGDMMFCVRLVFTT